MPYHTSIAEAYNGMPSIRLNDLFLPSFHFTSADQGSLVENIGELLEGAGLHISQGSLVYHGLQTNSSNTQSLLTFAQVSHCAHPSYLTLLRGVCEERILPADSSIGVDILVRNPLGGIRLDHFSEANVPLHERVKSALFEIADRRGFVDDAGYVQWMNAFRDGSWLIENRHN